jgi:hypothetical protein
LAGCIYKHPKHNRPNTAQEMTSMSASSPVSRGLHWLGRHVQSAQ